MVRQLASPSVHSSTATNCAGALFSYRTTPEKFVPASTPLSLCANPRSARAHTTAACLGQERAWFLSRIVFMGRLQAIEATAARPAERARSAPQLFLIVILFCQELNAQHRSVDCRIVKILAEPSRARFNISEEQSFSFARRILGFTLGLLS